MLSNAIIDVLGEGGKKAGTNESVKNSMQLLHGTYNIKNYLPHEFIHSCWGKAKDEIGINNEVVRKMSYKEFQQAVLTRWWTVGQAACQLDKEWEI